MPIVQSRRALVLVTSAAVAAGIGLGVAPAAQAANGKVTIDNTLPRWLGHASKNAVTPFAATTQTVRVYLTPNGGNDALKAAVAAVSDPSSAQYRQFLTTAQYAAKYAPTQQQVDQVSGFLTGAGLKVGSVEAHHRYVEASGTTSQLGAAFGVQLGTFTHDGQTVTAPSSAASVPDQHRRERPHRHRARHHRLHQDGEPRHARRPEGRRTREQPQRDAADRLRQRPPVLHLLRTGRGAVPGRLQDAPPAVPGTDAVVCAVRLHRATVPVRLREQLEPHRRGRHDRHHRRVRLAEDREGRQPVRREPR